ncbi:CD48 antigen-like [Scomber scombrus]|uniref:CD48 antigen-like n=1 Tax=Scomber scombrus TaxID=13677 RepID=UPI002DDB5121|nr:CD48 antigen-like [Scomber scombrus]
MEAQMRLIFFFIVMISAATEEIKNLKGIEGGNITLPDPVLELGFISLERKNVAMLDNGNFRMLNKNYTNKLHWDKNTGLFTITRLQRSDSGIYTIDSKEGNIFTTSYKLTVYDPVQTPAVNTVSVSTDSCILLCSVDKAETTLLWYKDEEILNQSSSALSLPLTVHKQDFNSSYRCEASNPAENKTLHVNITTSCRNNADAGGHSPDTQRYYILTGVIMAIVFVVVLAFLVHTVKKKFHKKSETITSQAQGRIRISEPRHTIY